MIVAIDGPAGSGKSTIAREVAARCGLTKLDTGAMYRSVAWAALDRGVDLSDESAVDELAESLRISFGSERSGNVSVFVDGVDVSSAIRTPDVDRSVSVVASYPGVRHAMLVPQRAFAEGRDVVAEGRDIGSVVFPAADLKIFLTADPRERARRRVLQRHEGEKVSEDELAEEIAATLEDIERRDRLDSQRAEAPLVCPEGAVTIDSTAYGIDQIVAMVSELIERAR